MSIDFKNSRKLNPFLPHFIHQHQFWQSQDHIHKQRKKDQCFENLFSRFQLFSREPSQAKKHLKHLLDSLKTLVETIRMSNDPHQDILIGIMVIDFSLNYNCLKKDNKVSLSSSSKSSCIIQAAPFPLSSTFENAKIRSGSFENSHSCYSIDVNIKILLYSSQCLLRSKFVRLNNLHPQEAHELVLWLDSRSTLSTKYHRRFRFFFLEDLVKDYLLLTEHRLFGIKDLPSSKGVFFKKMKNLNKIRSMKVKVLSRSIEDIIQVNNNSRVQNQQDFLNPPSQITKFDFRQSKELMFKESEQQRELLFLRKVNKELRKNFLFSLKPFWSKQFQEMLLKACQLSEVQYQPLTKPLIMFARLNQIRMMKLNCHFQALQMNLVLSSLYEKIYPGISLILRNILNRFKIPSLYSMITEQLKKQKGILQKKIEKEETLIEELRKWYQMEEDSQENSRLFYSIKQYHEFLFNKQPLLPNFLKNFSENLYNQFSQELISPIITPYSSKEFQEVKSMLMEEVTRQISKIGFISKQEELLRQKRKEFLSQIEHERLTQSKCLGCCSFFINNSNIYDEELCRTPFRVFSSINQVTKFEAQLKDTICAMINCGGGVIMFDCKMSEKELIPQGSFLTEQNKESEQRRIGSYLESFHPPIEINKNVQISFVPIVVSPFSDEENSFRKNFSRIAGNLMESKFSHQSYISGYYVTRLRVRPSNGTQLFYWFKTKKTKKENKQEDIYCCVYDGSKIKYLKIGEMVKWIKRRVKNFYIPDSVSQQAKLLMKKPFDVFGHQCRKPDSGVQVAESIAIETKKQPVKVKPEKMTKYEDIYPFMTLLIVNYQHLDGIKEKLSRLQVDTKLEKIFDNKNLGPAHNSVVLYHNREFDFVHQNLVKDSRFNFRINSPMMMIEIKKCLRFEGLTRSLLEEKTEFNKIYGWLQEEFPGQKLRMGSHCVKKQTQVYLVTQSKLSSLWLYFKLNHAKTKVIFRNPPGWDRAEKEGFKIVYEA